MLSDDILSFWVNGSSWSAKSIYSDRFLAVSCVMLVQTRRPKTRSR